MGGWGPSWSVRGGPRVVLPAPACGACLGFAGAGHLRGPVAVYAECLGDLVPAHAGLLHGVDGCGALGAYLRGQPGELVQDSAEGNGQKRGFELAAEMINNGDPRVRKVSPLTKQGILGKKLVLAIGDAETKPNSAVQAATREVQSASPAVEPSAIRVANRAAQRTWVQKLREHATRHYYRVRTDKGIASRAQAAQKALGVRRFFKILQPFIGVVPAAPVPDEPPKS